MWSPVRIGFGGSRRGCRRIHLALAAALLLLARPAAGRPAPGLALVGSPVDLNVGRSFQLVDSPVEDVARGAWLESSDNSFHGWIWWGGWGPDGPRFDPIQLAEGQSRQIQLPPRAVGADAAGGAVVVWQHPGLIFSRRVGSDDELGLAVHVNNPPKSIDDDGVALLAVQPDGSHDVSFIPGVRQYWTRHVTAEGDVSAPERLDDDGRRYWGPRLGCARPEGGAWVLWETTLEPTDTEPPFGPLGLHLRGLSAGGSPEGTPIEVLPPTVTLPDGASALDVTMICTQGGVTVIYATSQAPAKSGFDLVALRFDRSARRIGKPLLLVTGPGDQMNPRVVATVDGGSLVTWRSLEGARSKLVVQRFTAAWKRRGVAAVVADETDAAHQSLAIVRAGLRGAAVSWQRLAIDGGESLRRLRFLRVVR